MGGMGFRKVVATLATVSASVLLSACFDLSQKVTIDRYGGGHYEVAITAQGLLGDAIKDKHDTVADLKRNNVKSRTVERNGFVTQYATMDFKSFSDLKLSDESLSLTNHGGTLFGIGPSRVTFRRTFLVDRAKKENAPARTTEDDRFGTELAQTMFGGHTYVFSVSVPGSIERASSMRVGNTIIRPDITGDYWSHTVTWRMPLYTMLQAKVLRFEVDFSAYGSFSDAQSLPE